jgi:YHS domain-containing protein
MIRAILLFVLLVVIYQAIRSVFRSAVESYHRGAEPSALPGAEMVQDPQCRTYVVKDRAVTRRIRGATTHFCSTACADAYERTQRS